VAAGVCLAAALVLGVALALVQHRLDQARARDQAIAAVLGSRDARLFTSATSRGGATTVVVSPARHQMIVTAAGLPPLPAGKVYQLWLIGPPRTRSAGLLPAGAGDRQGPVLAGGVAPGDKFGMTVEPAGGTAQPTTTPIVVLTLPG
jgi:anti-sigma-K factor RskA